jgi:hypothetical protein
VPLAGDDLFGSGAKDEPAALSGDVPLHRLPLDAEWRLADLDRITDGNLNIALDAFANPGTVDAALAELETLDDDQRNELAARVCPMWNDALSRSIVLMYRACRRLGYDADGLNGEHLALLASILLCTEGETIPS